MKTLILIFSLNLVFTNWHDERCRIINKVVVLNEEVVPFKKNGQQIIIVDKLKDPLSCQFDANSIFCFVNEPPDSLNTFYSLDSITTNTDPFGNKEMAFGVYFSDSKGEENIEFIILKEPNDSLTIVNINTFEKSINR